MTSSSPRYYLHISRPGPVLSAHCALCHKEELLCGSLNKLAPVRYMSSGVCMSGGKELKRTARCCFCILISLPLYDSLYIRYRGRIARESYILATS